MEIGAMLDELREKALKDRNIWQELMDTRKAEQPLAAFCAKCRELGYQIYEMDLITAGEEFYATMRRSTNGGGENSPKLMLILLFGSHPVNYHDSRKQTVRQCFYTLECV